MLELIDSEVELHTERLILEPLTPRHAVHLFPLLLDERIYRFIPDDPPTTIATLTQRYERLATRRSPSGDELWLNWAVRRKPGPQYIGTVQATVYSNHSANLAYVLAPVYWGHGYATEACQRLLALLFNDYQVYAVRAEVDTRNTASQQLLERLAFDRTTFQPAADVFKGSSSDEYTYHLSREKWEDRH